MKTLERLLIITIVILGSWLLAYTAAGFFPWMRGTFDETIGPERIARALQGIFFVSGMFAGARYLTRSFRKPFKV